MQDAYYFQSKVPLLLESALNGIYENQFVIVNGRYFDNGFTYLLKDRRSLIATNDWSTADIELPDISSIIRSDMYYRDQVTIQAANILFACVDVGNGMLLKYDLQTKSYISSSDYTFRALSPVSGSCVAYNPNLSVLNILGGYYKIVQEYNISSDSWSYKSNINKVRYASGCAMDINSLFIYVFGGEGFDYLKLDSIEEYNVSTDSWTLLSSPTLVQATLYIKCILFSNVNHKIYCFSGSNDNQIYDKYVQIFDPTDKTLDDTSYEMVTGRKYFGLLMHENCLYIVGGTHGGFNTLDSNYSIEYLCITNTTHIPSASNTSPIVIYNSSLDPSTSSNPTTTTTTTTTTTPLTDVKSNGIPLDILFYSFGSFFTVLVFCGVFVCYRIRRLQSFAYFINIHVLQKKVHNNICLLFVYVSDCFW